MTQVVSHRTLTGEIRIRSLGSPRGYFGGQSGTGRGFSPFRYSPFKIIPSIFRNNISFIFCQRYNLLFPWRFDPIPGLGLLLRSFAITNIGHPTLGRNPDGWSARHSDLYLTKHNTHNSQSFMPRRDSNPQSQQASGRRTKTCHCRRQRHFTKLETDCFFN